MIKNLQTVIKRWTMNVLRFFGVQVVMVRGFVSATQYDIDGTMIKHLPFTENGITNAGLAAIAGRIGNVGSVTEFTYLALGTSSTAFSVSQTALVAETVISGLARTVATVTRSTTTQTNDTLQFDYTFTAGSAATIEEAGIFNAVSGGTMLARKLTTTFSLGTGQSFVLTYKIIVS